MNNKRVRGFELIDGLNGELPVRSTKKSAGYDFFASEDVVVPSIPKMVIFKCLETIADLLKHNKRKEETTEELIEDHAMTKPVLVKTGVKSYMREDEYLNLANRSSNPMKLRLLLSNGVGIIDSDYYNNEGNEGHIMFQFINFGFNDVTIKKGDKIGQGIFHKFYKADDDNVLDEERVGGFGSSDK